MSKVLGGIFGFGDKIKRRLRDAVSNPRDYLEMTADENQNEWRKNPDERSMGFFNPVPLGKVDPFLLRKQMKEAIAEIPRVENSIYSKMPGQALKDTKYVQRNVREQAELDHMIESGFLLPKAGGKSKKYFTAVDEVNPDVPAGNTMIRIARDKVKPDEAVSVKDVERFNFSTGSWESLIKEPSPVNMSRRDFMKKSAGIAGGTAALGIPGAKLLRKFAPEERQIAKEVAVEAAPKYKYNSLKEYLDDVTARAEDRATVARDQYGSGNISESFQSDMVKNQLLADEMKYSNAKQGQKYGDIVKGDEEALNAFSPQAKKEMKILKDKSISLDRQYGGTEPEHEVWTSWLTNSKGDIDSTLKALQELK